VEGHGWDGHAPAWTLAAAGDLPRVAQSPALDCDWQTRGRHLCGRLSGPPPLCSCRAPQTWTWQAADRQLVKWPSFGRSPSVGRCPEGHLDARQSFSRRPPPMHRSRGWWRNPGGGPTKRGSVNFKEASACLRPKVSAGRRRRPPLRSTVGRARRWPRSPGPGHAGIFDIKAIPGAGGTRVSRATSHFETGALRAQVRPGGPLSQLLWSNAPQLSAQRQPRFNCNWRRVVGG